MKIRKIGLQSVLRGGHSVVVGVLCAVMVVPPAMAADGVAIPAESHVAPLTQQEKVLHALNRFTFGARPGNVAAVQAMGLETWFQMQLHPERIDDAAFELERFPAMQLREAEMMRRFPSGPMVRRMSQGDLGLPRDPVERAIYADALAGYRAKSCAEGGKLGCGVAGSGRLLAQTIAHPATQSARVEDGAPDGVAGGVSMDGAPGVLGAGLGAVLGLGAEQRVARLVGMAPEEMLAFRAAMLPKDRVALVAGLTPEQTETVEALVEGPERVVATEAMEMRLMRDVESRRQLQAVMTEFWLNHFNVYLRKNESEPYMLAEYEQDAILPHALGRFEDLLVATATSPAMLMYLDNWESIGPDSVAAARVAQVQKARPEGTMALVSQKAAARLPKGINENYGRELMELHTLGVGGGYSQKDVVEVAKCFTGWTIDRPNGGGGMGGGRFQKMDDGTLAPGTAGEFVFEANRHEPGTKVVLGHTIAEGGMNEGLEVLHILATSPATAHFISKELAVRFVSDDPPAALVDKMAATFLKSDGDIAAVLTTMFHAKEFWAPQVYRAKVKTPLEFMVSAVRASDARVTDAVPLVQAMNRLGMPVWGMQTPNGYGWTAEDWVSSNALVSRMNFAMGLSGNTVPGTVMDWPGLLGGEAVASAATEMELERVLLGAPAGARTREAVMAEDTARVDTMGGLLLGSPEFQRR